VSKYTLITFCPLIYCLYEIALVLFFVPLLPRYVALNAAEGNMRGFTEALEGEALIPHYNTLYAASNLPNFLRPLVSLMLDERRASLVKAASYGGISVYDFWQRSADLIELRKKWTQAYQNAQVDAIIHPALPLPAVQHGISGDLTSAFSYMMLSNLLLWPSGVVPVTTIREDEAYYSLVDLPKNQRDSFARLANKVMEGSAGLPLSVAVLTSSFQDEKCLQVMKVIEDLAQFAAEPTAYLQPKKTKK